jgi:hypothetical protein
MTQYMNADLTPQQIEISKYERRKEDFQNLATSLMVRLKADKDNAVITSEQLFEIEDAFEKVETAGFKGRWKTALKELNKIVIGGAVTQSLVDEVRATIENYISQSYV